MKLTQNDIKSCFCRIKRNAMGALNKKKYEHAIQEIVNGASLAYNFNLFYSDDELESMIHRLSNELIEKKNNLNIQEKYVLYDSFGMDFCGLSQQYIRALDSLNIEFLYIYENRDPMRSIAIEDDLRKCRNKVTIFELDNKKTNVEQIRDLYNVIFNYSPSKMFLHIHPWSVVALTVAYALPHTQKYNINLTDHAFWLGSQCVDYNIEFRNYGANVSIEKRGLKKEQILYLPYYPIISEGVFEGFPQEIEGRLKIFSGGNYYKIYGLNGFYFDIVKQVLNKTPNAVLLYAGGGDDRLMRKFIKVNGFENRIFLLGLRRDINEVFKACDIYLGTYPFGGGLMSQYAAYNAKPILAYYSDHILGKIVEGVVCQKKDLQITHATLDSLLEEVERLNSSKNYREKKGNELKECLFAPSDFNECFSRIVAFPSYYSHKKEQIDYGKITDLYLEVENNFQSSFLKFFLSKYRFKIFFNFPLFSIKMFPKICVLLLSHINKKYLHI